MIGTKLAHYEITAHLGSGGMGEVFQATDTKLGRSVAIKLLPEAFARDAERVARFEREARVLASLNDSHIAAIYGLEESGDRKLLVMELAEGETLADRIKRGPLPMDEALNIAKQIAEALEAAHEKGVMHRDLKPANIKVSATGQVKVLDFGLAKAFADDVEDVSLSNSPTLISMTATNAGVILGTAAYMSPEQAKGLKVDRRTDIFSFGAVLYEMLTGKQAFHGDSVSGILAAVLRMEPDWTLMPEDTPTIVRRLLRRCLQKDRGRRIQTAIDVRVEIEEAKIEPSMSAVPAPIRLRNWGRLSFIAVSTLTTAIAAVMAFLYFREAPRVEPSEIRFEITTPKTSDPVSFALSPDGRNVVFVASGDAGASRLWLRPLDSVTAQPLAGTEGAVLPFWSPDSRSIGFFADLKLKRIDIVGGAPQVLAIANNPRGGSWNRDGAIVFAATAVGPLLKVAGTGGEPVAVTRRETGQAGHLFPQFLPDGRHFIYFEGQGVYAGSLDGGPSKRLTNADTAAVVSPSGFLLFVRQTTLFAQAFDSERQELSGNPFPVAEQVAGFSATSAIVAYRSGAAAGARQLTWLDRSGKSAGTIGAPEGFLSSVELSPDGKRVAVQRLVNGNADIWLIDAARGVPTRFTFDASSDQRPVWSPDGSRVMFDSNRKGVFNLYWKLSSGAGADELLLESDQSKFAYDWSFDGRFLLFRGTDLETGYDLWVLPVSGDKKAFPFLKTSFDERNGQFSPDGKWIAYQSNESGRFEIYVQPFPGPGGKFQISTNGGTQVRWNKNGKEIFYVSLDSKMMAASVKLSPEGQSLETGTPLVLFPVRIAGGPLPGPAKQQYAVSSDGQRFLVNVAADEGAAAPITLIYNWKPPKTIREAKP